MSIFLRMLKRLGRVILGGAIVGSAYALVPELQTTPLGIFLIPAGTAILEAVAKGVRDKFGVKLPL